MLHTTNELCSIMATLNSTKNTALNKSKNQAASRSNDSVLKDLIHRNALQCRSGKTIAPTNNKQAELEWSSTNTGICFQARDI